MRTLGSVNKVFILKTLRSKFFIRIRYFERELLNYYLKMSCETYNITNIIALILLYFQKQTLQNCNYNDSYFIQI